MECSLPGGNHSKSDYMKTTAITVTEAARNFFDCISRAHCQNNTFVLLKNGRPIARIVPDREKVCYGRDLAKVLGNLELPPDEARAWRRALRAGRKMLKAPVDKWR